ncbi:Uncharacterised protein [Mycobacteroides abscessus subsp. abscessus]|nr:Uncharacterised protein [Mycobacteroides abscessus subsp. abscessus]
MFCRTWIKPTLPPSPRTDDASSGLAAATVTGFSTVALSVRSGRVCRSATSASI